MDNQNQTTQKKNSIFNRALLTTKIVLTITEIGSNIKHVLEQHIANRVHNKCQAEGFIRSDTIMIQSYSAGLVKGVRQEFQVVYECLVCYPTEGMIIDNVECKNNSLAGIRAFYHDPSSDTTPLEIFLAKDFHYNNTQYDKIKEGDTFSVRVIGIRFELNDSHITVMASLA
jgi:DNA-directed RNA polymerase subunit E'/Rpb7